VTLPLKLPDARRRRLCGAALAAGLLPAGPVQALMAGSLPDTPAARVDPNAATSPWSGVLSVVAAGSAFSGVAIGPQHVLTAAHVTAGQAATALRVVVNLGATPQSMPVATSTTYPGTVFPYDDLCVLRLAQALPAGITIHPIADLPVSTGTQLTLVGYGASGNGSATPTLNASSSIKRRGGNVIDQLTDRLDASGRSSPFWICDFDGPSGTGLMGGASLGNTVET
jgi:Trypsin